MLEFAGEDMEWLTPEELHDMRKTAKGRALRLVKEQQEAEAKAKEEAAIKKQEEEELNMKEQFVKDLREMTGEEPPPPEQTFEEKKKNRATTVFLLDELKVPR